MTRATLRARSCGAWRACMNAAVAPRLMHRASRRVVRWLRRHLALPPEPEPRTEANDGTPCPSPGTPTTYPRLGWPCNRSKWKVLRRYCVGLTSRLRAPDARATALLAITYSTSTSLE